MSEIQDISIMDLLPESIKNDSQIKSAAISLDKELAKVNGEVENLIILPRIDELDHDLVDILAQEFNTPFYDEKLPLDKKRSLVKNSINFYRRKGTPAALEEIISIIFNKSEIEEWYEYDGEPYKFRVITTDLIDSPEKYQTFCEAINQVKNTRSCLESLSIKREETTSIFANPTIHIATNCELTPSWISLLKENTLNLGIQACVHIVRKLSLKGSD